MATVARLTADLTANTAKFETGMKKAQNILGNFASIAGSAGAAAGTAFAAAAVALGALAVRQAQVIDATSKLSSTLGINIREFQALSLVADEAGIDQEALGKAITKTQQFISEAAQGSKSYNEALKRLGLSSKELINLSPDQQFQKIAESLAKIENPTQRTAAALEIFGKNGRSIVGLLPELSAKIDEARAFNDKFNISLTELDAAKVEEANDTFARVGKAISGLGNTIAIELAPLVTAASEALLNAGIDGETFGNAVRGGVEIAAKAIDFLRVAILGIRSIFNEVVIAISEAVAKVSVLLFDLGKSLADTFNKIPGISVEAEDGLLNIGLAARKAADEAKKSLQSINSEAEKFIATSDKIAKIQKDANVRAQKAVAQKKFLSPLVANDEGDNLGKLDKLEKKSKSAQEAQKTYNDVLKESFKGLGDALVQSGNKADAFKNVLVNSLGQIANIAIESFAGSIFGGKKTGSIGGDILGSVFGSIGSGIGGFFKNLLPSFDVGSYNVPKDMTANIHKGEMIIPAKEAAAIRAGGSRGASIVQNITIGAGVSGAVRAEVAKMLPDIRKATIAGVEDARLRGASI